MSNPRKAFESALLAERVVARVADRSAAKRPSFQEARSKVWEFFDKEGWQTSSPTLKVPHITSPDGNTRLWFKPQAVYFTVGKHNMGDARSLHMDIRDDSPEQIMKALGRASGV